VDLKGFIGPGIKLGDNILRPVFGCLQELVFIYMKLNTNHRCYRLPPCQVNELLDELLEDGLLDERLLELLEEKLDEHEKEDEEEHCALLKLARYSVFAPVYP